MMPASENAHSDAGIDATADQQSLEAMVADVGGELQTSLRGVLGAILTPTSGPQALATTLGVDKVLASRVLKATRSADPIGATHRMPGPAPLRRLVTAAAARGVPPTLIDDATRAIDRFESFIGQHAGDRSLLDTMLSAWVPEARREFEVRRKQAAFKAMSQLRGVQADAIVATVLLHPAAEPDRIDVVWINGLTGLHRIRPGVPVKLTTRRLAGHPGDRHPTTLGGEPIDTQGNMLLERFSSVPTPRLNAKHVGDTVYYTLADDAFGASNAVDLFFAEVSRGDLKRFVDPGSNRKAFTFAEVSLPAHLLQFDVLVHQDLFPGQDPSLRLYDTTFEGIADVNDAARDLDRLNMAESIEHLGTGLGALRSSDVPRYSELVQQGVASAGFEGERLRVYRCRIEYPIYGTQVVAVFQAMERS